MSDLVFFCILNAIFGGVAVFFWMRARYWKRCYRQLMDDAFDRGCRAVLTEQDIVNRAAGHGPKLGHYQPHPFKKP
jgi:hypothetical protein